MKNTNKKLTRLVHTALFCALCTTATLIAFPSGIGYVNAGDMVVLLAAFTLSPMQAAAAAGVGSALADVLCGYTIYAPATLIIKGCMAASTCYLVKMLKHVNVPSHIGIALSAVFGELCMTCGYLAYEWYVLGYGMAALSSIPANLIQGAFGCVGGILFYYILKSTKLTNKLPAM